MVNSKSIQTGKIDSTHSCQTLHYFPTRNIEQKKTASINLSFRQLNKANYFVQKLWQEKSGKDSNYGIAKSALKMFSTKQLKQPHFAIAFFKKFCCEVVVSVFLLFFYLYFFYIIIQNFYLLRFNLLQIKNNNLNYLGRCIKIYIIKSAALQLKKTLKIINFSKNIIFIINICGYTLHALLYSYENINKIRKNNEKYSLSLIFFQKYDCYARIVFNKIMSVIQTFIMHAKFLHLI